MSRTELAPPSGRSFGALQVAPLSVENVIEMGGPAIAKLLKETYIRPEKAEEGFMSLQPDSRSSLLPMWTQAPTAQVTPPSVDVQSAIPALKVPQPLARNMACQVAFGRL